MAKRPQTLNFINGYAVPGETFRAAPAAVPEPAPAPAPAPASVPSHATGLPMSTLPKFLEFDRKVRDCRLRKHATRLSGPSAASAAASERTACIGVTEAWHSRADLPRDRATARPLPP